MTVPRKDYPDAQKEIEIIQVNAIPSVVVDYPDFQREVEVIAGGESMSWKGQWDRESGYAPGATVRFKGHAYVCFEGVNETAGITGTGPAPKGSPVEHWEYPGGRPLPMGRIAPSEEFGGILRLTDPTFKQFDFSEGDPEHPGPATWRAHAWEFWVKEVQQKTTMIGFGSSGTHARYHFPGVTHGTIATDNGRQTSAIKENTAGEFTEGLFELPSGATKVGVNERYYLIVWGGTWQEDEPLPKQKLHITLPLPYVLTPGAGIVAGPGNKTPPEDFEHWALVA